MTLFTIGIQDEYRESCTKIETLLQSWILENGSTPNPPFVSSLIGDAIQHIPPPSPASVTCELLLTSHSDRSIYTVSGTLAVVTWVRPWTYISTICRRGERSYSKYRRVSRPMVNFGLRMMRLPATNGDGEIEFAVGGYVSFGLLAPY